MLTPEQEAISKARWELFQEFQRILSPLFGTEQKDLHVYYGSTDANTLAYIVNTILSLHRWHDEYLEVVNYYANAAYDTPPEVPISADKGQKARDVLTKARE